MNRKLVLPTAIALALSAATATAEDFSDKISVRGFGTFGVMHATVENADVMGSVFMPDGAGYTRDWDMRSDSRFAAQANIAFTDKLSFTVQAISQYRYDHSFTPQIEWANLKYSFSPSFSARIGRIALPTFLVSDSRLVGYANTWVRPPEEVYQVGSITNNDGMDVSYSFSSGNVRNSLQAFYGMSEADISSGKAEADSIWGVNYLSEIGAASVRLGYIRMDVDLDLPDVQPLITGLSQVGAMLSGFGFTSQGAQAESLARKYQLNDMNLSFLSLGGAYDAGAWFASAELIDFGGDGLLSDTRGGYVMAGARLGKFTPYAIVAKLKADIPTEPGIDPTALGPFAGAAIGLNAGVTQSLNQFQGSQESAALGLRWDAFNNIAVKAQYNYVDIGKGSTGKLGNVQPGFELGSNYSLYSLTVDYIF